MARFRKASVLSILLLVLTLVAGFLGGVAWQRNQAMAPEPDETPTKEPRDRSDRRLVIDEVGLEPAKRAEVDAILQHFMVRVQALHKEFTPRHRALLHGARDSIKSVLEPDQRALYDSLLALRYGSGHRGGDSSGTKKDKGHRDGHGER